MIQCVMAFAPLPMSLADMESVLTNHLHAYMEKAV